MLHEVKGIPKGEQFKCLNRDSVLRNRRRCQLGAFHSAKAGYRVCLGSGKISCRFPRQTAKSGYV